MTRDSQRELVSQQQSLPSDIAIDIIYVLYISEYSCFYLPVTVVMHERATAVTTKLDTCMASPIESILPPAVRLSFVSVPCA